MKRHFHIVFAFLINFFICHNNACSVEWPGVEYKVLADSLTARYMDSVLSPFTKEGRALGELEVSMAAPANVRRMEFEARLKQEFPEGEPRWSPPKEVGEDATKGEWEDFLLKMATFRDLSQSKEKWAERHDTMIKTRDVMVRVAHCVEQFPQCFTLWDFEKPYDPSSSDRFPFALNYESGERYSVYQKCTGEMGEKTEAFKEFFRKNWRVYNFEDIGSYSDRRSQSAFEKLQASGLGDMIRDLLSMTGSLEEMIKSGFRNVLSREYPREEYERARFVIKEIVEPWVEVLKTIQQEALNKKNVGDNEAQGHATRA